MLLIYKTVIELFPSDLDASVNKHLKDEWSLHGSPYISPLQDEDHPGLYMYFHCQAIIKNSP